MLILLSSFGTVAVKTSAFFALSAREATDTPVATSALDQAPTIDKIGEPTQSPIVEITETANISKPKTVAVQTCSGYYGYITIAGKSICLASTGTTAGNLSYNFAYIFNNASYNSYNQYIFGHNSANIFGSLGSLPVGTTFSVTTNGQTTNYRISFKEVVCDFSNPAYPCSNYSEPVLNMYDAVQPARRGANLAIMTCAGTSIGNGDATHRLVVYANKI